MTLVRRLVELGRSARAESKVRTRQPLGRALVHAPGWNALPGELKSQVIDELNVRAVVADDGSGDLLVVDTVVKAELPSPRQALRQSDPGRGGRSGGGRRDGDWLPHSRETGSA